MPSFRQRDASDCGVACLSYIFHHYALQVSVALLRQKSGTNKGGTTALGLVETAESFGFNAKGIRCKFEALRQIPMPAIAHVKLDDKRQHYVVIRRVDKKFFRIMDPALGKLEKWPREKFEKIWTGVLVMLAPGIQFKPEKKITSSGARILELLVPQKGVLIQAFVGVVISTILSLSTTVYVQKIVDNVIVDGNKSLLNLLGCSMLVILGFRLILGYFQSLLIMRTAQKIDVAMILGYYRHLLRLPQQFFDTMRVGEITSRVRDAIQIRDFINSSFLNLVINPLILIFAFSAMFFYSWQLALLSLALLPLNTAIYFLSDWRNKKYQRVLLERGADFDAQLVESLHVMPLVRGFQLEETMSLKAEGRLVRLFKTAWSTSMLGLWISSAGTLITQAYIIALLWIGASQVLQANLTAGELMSCYFLAGYLTGPIVALIGMNSSIRQTLAATDRLYEIIDLEREKDVGTIELTKDKAAAIRFESVHFKYPGRLPTLQDISLVLPKGAITVLMGESGCGKSTLLGLMQRLYAPERGKILIGDLDLQYFTLRSLRESIAVVSQRVDLLSGTVLENLAPGNLQPDMQKLIGLCRSIGIMEFIETLPQGFYNHLSENGINLSGGQRQRLALIRALYSDAPILLLDEPSSSLDAKSEGMLMNVLSDLRNQGKLIVVSAHNRRLLEIADQIVEFEAGSITSTRQHDRMDGPKVEPETLPSRSYE